ncbi:MAG: hypothetical protein R2774_08835 [Saprospiraceae bacterium]
MKITKIVLIFSLFWSFDSFSKEPSKPTAELPPALDQQTSWRAVCTRPTKSYDMEVNNVRARLLTGGDLWSTAQYIVPKPTQGQPIVSALYSGGVWIGGLNRAGMKKVAAVTYRNEGMDYFAGPLDVNGTTEFEICQEWDRFFVVNGKEAKDHAQRVIQSKNDGNGGVVDIETIPESVKNWPGQGSPYFRDKYGFELPDQPLGDFYDFDGDSRYDPTKGDFPTIYIRDCEPDSVEKAAQLIPDEMVFWIYNDAGGPHTLSGPEKIQMEVQVQAFAYASNDEINDMTFYRYKLINKANEDLIDCYFAMWIDPDLGCYQDDYIGCDLTIVNGKPRSLAYVYNEDAIDGIGSTTACESAQTYGTNIPILGMDYFRGPRGPKVFLRDENTNALILDTFGNVILTDPEPFTGAVDTLVELGMNSFTYTENCSVGSPLPQTCDPQRGREEDFYNLLKGLWKDGTPVTQGGSGYNPESADITKFVFPSDPDDDNGWSMCTEELPYGDRRTLQATGPLLLQPGAINELIIGVVYVPTIDYPCPDITRLKYADDIAQSLFDNCFDTADGPAAPDVTAVELDKELILMLSNETTSNNFNEAYKEVDIQAPQEGVDNEYKFEGYRIYQLATASVSVQELNDITKARQIALVDVRNGIKEIYNWTAEANPIIDEGPVVFIPEKKVVGLDKGIRSSFRITEDAFAVSDKRLINHKQYHYLVIAYGYNNWKVLDIVTGEGQRKAYLEGRENIGGVDKKPYTFVPRPIVYEKLNSEYGEGAIVTRVSGEGNPGIFLQMTDDMDSAILSGSFDGRITYKKGAGPIEAKVVDPLRVKDGKYKLEIIGTFNHNKDVCSFDNTTFWKLTDVTDESSPVVLLNNKKLSDVKEYILQNRGVSLIVNSVDEVGTDGTGPNGAVGANYIYATEGGPTWFNAVRDNGIIQSNTEEDIRINILDLVRNTDLDATGSLSKMGGGSFFPFLSSRFETDPLLPVYFSTAARDYMLLATSRNINVLRYRDLNNVDIVFTKNKDLWSKCIVIETASPEMINAGNETIGNAKNFELRKSPSKDKNGVEIEGSTGFSYFPGYAIDVETGKRLNIFFGENSIFSGDEMKQYLDGNVPVGGDMLFNPSSQYFADLGNNDLRSLVMGGHHFIYVTRQEYDGCESLGSKLTSTSNALTKIKAIASITWTSWPVGVPSHTLLPLEEGLIPNDLRVQLRVNNPFGESRRFDINNEKNCDTDGDSPVYEFAFEGTETEQLDEESEYEGALANVNVVPNPYYAYSSYEPTQFTNVVKITNLPARAIVTIYSIDGSFIRQYNRDERGTILNGTQRPTSTTQVYPDLDWDMKNFKNVPVSSGVYLIHISAPEYGEERTIKWFGIGRKFDPSGL